MKTTLLFASMLLSSTAFAATQYCSGVIDGKSADFVVSESQNKVLIVDSSNNSYKKCLKVQPITSVQNTSCGKKIQVLDGTLYEICDTNLLINQKGIDQGASYNLSGVCLAPQDNEPAEICSP